MVGRDPVCGASRSASELFVMSACCKHPPLTPPAPTFLAAPAVPACSCGHGRCQRELQQWCLAAAGDAQCRPLALSLWPSGGVPQQNSEAWVPSAGEALRRVPCVPSEAWRLHGHPTGDKKCRLQRVSVEVEVLKLPDFALSCRDLLRAG